MLELLSSISLENAWPLLALPLPLAIYRWLPAATDNSAALRVPFLTQLEAIGAEGARRGRRLSIKIILLCALWLMLVLAACRPVLTGKPVQIPTEARDLLLAVDISGSMDERDMLINNRTVTRIDVVKYVLGEFIDRRQGDRIGLVLFADNAYVQAPLTYDTTTVRKLMLEAQLGFAGQKTAIGDAIGLSIKRLVERPSQSRTLILLTDGINNAGSIEPLDAVTVAKENDVKIYTIGVAGNPNVGSSFWGATLLRNPTRNLDESTLKTIAEETGGQYFRANDSQELASIYAELDRLEPVDQEKQFFRPQKQIFYWPLGFALGIALLLAFSNSSAALLQTGARS